MNPYNDIKVFVLFYNDTLHLFAEKRIEYKVDDFSFSLFIQLKPKDLFFSKFSKLLRRYISRVGCVRFTENQSDLVHLNF